MTVNTNLITNKVKLAVFDLDGTLAPIGKPIESKNVALLKEIENKGIRIAISSGKTLYYLVGMFRQIGLSAPVFIGENGNCIAYGVDLPLKLCESLPIPPDFFKTKENILKEVSTLFKDKFWLQPNDVALTLFFKDAETKTGLHDFFEANIYDSTVVYEHSDSFDIVPKGIDKKTSLQALGKELNISSDEMIAIGDGVNDIPMIKYCKYSIGIAPLDTSLTTWHYDDIFNALDFINKTLC